jgi:hypothetical protein
MVVFPVLPMIRLPEYGDERAATGSLTRSGRLE